MADRLTLTRALEGSGMASDAAERIATEIYDAVHDNVATKADLEHAVAILRGELREVEQRLDLRFEGVNTRFEGVNTRFEGVNTRFAQLERRIDGVVIRLGALAVVLLTLLFGALHLWPPH